MEHSRTQKSVYHINRFIISCGFDIVGLEQNAAPCASKNRDATEYISIKLPHQDMRTASYLARLAVAWWTAREDSDTGYGIDSQRALFTDMVQLQSQHGIVITSILMCGMK